jgi:glycosyltransferase involved in cell wall biosynthesis
MTKLKKPHCVVFYIPDFWPGGAQKQAALLFNEVARKLEGRAMLMYVRPGPNLKWLDTQVGVVTQLKYHSLSDPRLVLDIWARAAQFGATHVVSWLHAGDTVCGMGALGLPRRYKWVVMERDSYYPPTWKFRLRELVTKKAGRIVCNSKQGAEFWLAKGVGRERLGVIQNIVPQNKASGTYLKSSEAQEKMDIVSWGRLEPQKDPLRALKSLKILVEKYNLICFMGGSGSLEPSVRRAIEDADIGARVLFPGYIEDPSLILKELPVFLSLSKHEGTPNAVLEALSHGVVVVVSDIEEHRAIVGQSYPFLISASQTPEEIADICFKAHQLSETERSQALSNGMKYLNEATSSSVGARFLLELDSIG